MEFKITGDDLELYEPSPLITFPYVETQAKQQSQLSLPFDFKILRQISCETGILTHPHGSVKYSQGHTCVVAAVYGPTEVRISKELYHRGAVDVLYRPKVTGTSQLAQSYNPMDPTLEERRLESILVGVLETSIHLEDLAGSGYNIIVHEYENDGGILAASINATTIALLDAGSSLRHTVAAVHVALTKDKKLIIDPSVDQVKGGVEGELTFVFSNELKILYNNVKGHVPVSVMKIGMEEALEGAKELFQYYYVLTSRKCKLLDNNSLMEMPAKPPNASRMIVNLSIEGNEDECSEISSDDEEVISVSSGDET